MKNQVYNVFNGLVVTECRNENGMNKSDILHSWNEVGGYAFRHTPFIPRMSSKKL